MLHSCCSSRGAEATCTSLVGHHPGRRRRRRPEGEHGETEHLPSSRADRGSIIGGRRNRRRDGSGLAISVVLFASSTAASAVVPVGLELPPSRIASRRVSLHRPPGGTNRAAFASASSATAAPGLEPVGRWAAAECRRLAGAATHLDAAAAAAALTAGVTRRTTSFLRGGLRGSGGRSGSAGAGGGGNYRLRMISGGFSGEFTPPDEPWKRRRAQQQQGEEGVTAPQSDARFAHTAGDIEEEEGEGEVEEEEEEEVYSWTPKESGQGSWDSRSNAILGMAEQEQGPVWRVDLKRGVYTGDVKIKQVR